MTTFGRVLVFVSSSIESNRLLAGFKLDFKLDFIGILDWTANLYTGEDLRVVSLFKSSMSRPVDSCCPSVTIAVKM